MPEAQIRWRRASLAAVVGLGAAAGPAAAQSCVNEIDRLTRQYDLSAEAPRAGTTEAPAAPSAPPSTSPGPTATESRAQSGGVLSPPDTAAPTAIRPPRSSGDRDASPPDAAAAAAAARGDGGKLPAAERARMTALLQAAQAAAREGNEQQCLEHLREAETVPGVPAAK